MNHSSWTAKSIIIMSVKSERPLASTTVENTVIQFKIGEVSYDKCGAQ